MTLHPRLKEDLTNREIGLLTVKEYLGHRLWRCVCACGKTTKVRGTHLRHGTTSCGCVRSKKLAAINTKHGHSTKAGESPEYRAWAGMIQRCEDKNYRGYHRHGGRGIKVCPQWRADFTTFLADMGLRPSKAHSLDRRENNGNYEPGNCRWATRKEQSRNMRTNRLLTINGETRPLVEWADISGLSRKLIGDRLADGWSEEKAVTTPARRWRRANS